MAKKYTSGARDWGNTLIWAAVIAIFFRSFLLEPFNIPSGSMIPTLQVGDHIFVKKWSYGYSRFSFPFGSWNMWDGRFFATEPERGDVIVFRKPGDKVDYVKRLIGLPGDTVQMVLGRLYINGELVERANPRPYIIANLPKYLRKSGHQSVNPVTGEIMAVKGNKIYIDNKPADFNYTIEYKSNYICELNPGECRVIAAMEYTEILPGGKKHSIVEISDETENDNTTLFTVPDGHFFMMGDDRDFSADSRAGVGYVPRDNLMGKVWFVWYSHNYYSPLLAVWNWGSKMRITRLFTGIN